MNESNKMEWMATEESDGDCSSMYNLVQITEKFYNRTAFFNSFFLNLKTI